MALAKRSELFLSYVLLSPHIANRTISPSLLTNGRQLGCSEKVVSHCLLCPVKLSTEFCMPFMDRNGSVSRSLEEDIQ